MAHWGAVLQKQTNKQTKCMFNCEISNFVEDQDI